MDVSGFDERDLWLRSSEMVLRPSPLATAAIGLPLSGPPASAGTGGAGVHVGTEIGFAAAAFEPVNIADASSYSSAAALQHNAFVGSQVALQVAGLGGNGGGGNIASSPDSPSLPSGGGYAVESASLIGTGGDGAFTGSLVQSSVAIMAPTNIAVAGYGGTASAEQSNVAVIHQGATQVAGIGGNGGASNVSAGPAGFASPEPVATTPGEAHVGAGGAGFAAGGIAHASFAFFNPVNIALAANGSTAHAEQSNLALIDQEAIQLAGIGGAGGHGNIGFEEGSSPFRLTGSDAINLLTSNAGNGGDGGFFGSLVDVDIVVYAPVNIAVAGYRSSAEAHQENALVVGQSSIQAAGIGGDGGDHNASLGDEWVIDALGLAELLG